MGKERTSIERRRFNRFVVKIPVECRPVSAGREYTGKELVYANSKNISSNGILLNWPGEYRLPKFLRLGIQIALTSKAIQSIARMVWAEEKKSRGRSKIGVPEEYNVGLSFIEDEHSKVPRLISRGTDFYWGIFERTGDIQAYLLHKGICEESEEVAKDG